MYPQGDCSGDTFLPNRDVESGWLASVTVAYGRSHGAVGRHPEANGHQPVPLLQYTALPHRKGAAKIRGALIIHFMPYQLLRKNFKSRVPRRNQMVEWATSSWS